MLRLHASKVYSSITRWMSSASLPTYETLKLSQPKPYVTLVELNRPTKLNAMNEQLFEELKKCFEQLNTEKSCRVIVLTGTGRAFSTGIDVKYFSSNIVSKLGEIDDIGRKAMHVRQMILRTQASLQSVDKCEKPVIAAVHGHCIGAGVDLTACCDIRYSSNDATFSIKEVDMGLAADVGTLQIFPRYVIDHSRFRELVYTSQMFDVKEAQQIGLIGRVFDTQQATVDAAVSLADVIAQKSPIAVQGSKINLNYARDHSTDESFQFISTWNSSMLLSEDIAKSVMASAIRKEKGDIEVQFDDV